MRHIVCGILRRDHQILLAHRSPHRIFYPDCWRFPGGHVVADESVKDALQRELLEEIGVTPTRFQTAGKIATTSQLANNDAIFYMFLISQWIGEPSIKDTEHTELKWMTIVEAIAVKNLALPEYVPLLKSLPAPQTPGANDLFHRPI